MTLNLFPAARKTTIRKSLLDLSSGGWIVLPPVCSRRLRERVQECAARIGEALNQPIRVTLAAPRQGTILLRMHTDAKEIADQGFELDLTATAHVLRAGGEAGTFYGCLAFTQLVEQFGARPPSVKISDAPDFPARGVMLDVSRCKVPTLATCKQLIDRLAGVRINQLQLYVEHTFAFSAHEPVWHDSSPLTHENILELDRYCADRFVELVPNLNSFGHLQRWLKLPEYRHLAECPTSRNPFCLAPNAASIRFLEELYDEYLPHFSSTLFNVGCDETQELGQGRSKARVAKTTRTEVYLEFIKKIHKLVTNKGRRMQFWGDIILHQPELIKELPEDIVALCWGYEADHPYRKECRAFQDAGVPFYVCPGTSAWNSITGRTDNALANIENSARNGLKYGASGCLNTDWGDGGHHQVLPVSYAGFAAGAAYSWCLQTNREVDLAGAISRHFFADPTGILGAFCLDLGRTLNQIPGLVRANCSAINQLLFSQAKHLDLSNVTQAQYKAAEAWLGDLEGRLPDARPACEDRDVVMRELRCALAASRFALHRGRYFQFGDGDPSVLRRELQNLIMRHEDQWLARNRRGGLHESSSRLRNLLSDFDTDK